MCLGSTLPRPITKMDIAKLTLGWTRMTAIPNFRLRAPFLIGFASRRDEINSSSSSSSSNAKINNVPNSSQTSQQRTNKSVLEKDEEKGEAEAAPQVPAAQDQRSRS